MHFYGPFSESGIAGDLFAKAALRDVNHDLALARTQRFKTLLECSQRLFTRPPGTIMSEAGLNGIEKVLITERFCQELNGTAFIACTVMGMSPCPVTKMIGMFLFAAARSC
jgi:hypothetical protein